MSSKVLLKGLSSLVLLSVVACAKDNSSNVVPASRNRVSAHQPWSANDATQWQQDGGNSAPDRAQVSGNGDSTKAATTSTPPAPGAHDNSPLQMTALPTTSAPTPAATGTAQVSTSTPGPAAPTANAPVPNPPAPEIPAPAEPAQPLAQDPPQPPPAVTAPAPVADPVPAPAPAPAPAQNACGTPYNDKDASWAPGLPNLPSTNPIYTDEPNAAAKGLRFTDAAQDDLMALAVDRSNALPSIITGFQANSRNFSKRIIDLAITADVQKSGLVKVQVVYAHPGVAKGETINLRGKIDQLGGKRADVKLTQISQGDKKSAAAAAAEFGGVMTCADLERGCREIVLRLDRLNKKGKIVSSAYLVHRWNDVSVTMSDYERQHYARFPNTNYSVFAENLSNMLNNVCVVSLNEVQSHQAKMDDCSASHLQTECGGESLRNPSFQAISLRTWAAAYGRSNLALTFAPKADLQLSAVDAKALTLSGPMVRASGPAGVNHALQVSNAKEVQSAQLVNNDGGGNLNVQLDFAGQPESHMRLSVTNQLPSAAEMQAIRASVQQMPSVTEDDAAVALPEDLK